MEIKPVTNTLSLGQRLKYFRERGRVSQLDMEVAIGASPGSLSRIENGKVNPTKETLNKVATTLRLNHHFRSALLGAISITPTDEEISEAQSEVLNYFGGDGVLAYLIDEWGVLYAFSTDLITTLGITKTVADKAVRKNIIEIMCSKEIGLRYLFEEADLVKTMAIEIARIREEIGLDLIEVTKELWNDDVYIRAYELSTNISAEFLISSDSKQVPFTISGRKTLFEFSRERLKRNDRFEIIELRPFHH